MNNNGLNCFTLMNSSWHAVCMGYVAMKIKNILLAFSVIPAIVLCSCDVEKKEEGKLPEVEVDIDAKKGKLPDYDVETADIEVKKKKVEIEVPDVDITMPDEKKD